MTLVVFALSVVVVVVVVVVVGGIDPFGCGDNVWRAKTSAKIVVSCGTHKVLKEERCLHQMQQCC